MVIDRFVYDPNAGAGKLAASLTRGIFRFVGGKLSKQANGVSMRTPAATIGIRGGVMLVNVRPGCTGPVPGAGSGGCNALEVIFVYGKGVTVTGLTGASQTLTRPGFEVTVAAPGAAPSDPHPAPPGATEALLAQLDGRPGGNGGAPIVPTEVMVTESGIANVISANIAASIQAADRTQPLPPQPHSVSPTVELTQLNNQNVSVPAATATPVGGGSALPVAEFFTSPTPSGTAIPTALLPTTPSETPQIAAATIPRPITTPVITPPAITPPAIPVATPPVATPPGIPPVVIPPVVIPPVVTPPVIAPLVTISGVTGNFFMNGGLVPYTGGMVANGEFSASTASGPVSFPVTAGSGYTSPDNTFFYAGLTTANQPNPGQPSQGAFVYGGKPVNASFYQANSTSSRVLAFALPPALASSFLNALPAGLAAAAYNSPLFLATPANSTFSTTSGGTKALQASLAVSGSGPGQSSAIAVLVGNVFNASLNGKSAAQPIINGIIHGSYLANATGQPIRIYSPYVTPADGVGNSFYGGNGISGFVVSNGNCCGPGEVASNAYATNTATGSTTPYQFVVPAIVPTTTPSVPAGANTPQQNLTGYFGGIMTKEPGTGAGSPTPYALSGTANITTTAANGQVAATLAGSDPLTAGASGVNSMILGLRFDRDRRHQRPHRLCQRQFVRGHGEPWCCVVGQQCCRPGHRHQLRLQYLPGYRDRGAGADLTIIEWPVQRLPISAMGLLGRRIGYAAIRVEPGAHRCRAHQFLGGGSAADPGRRHLRARRGQFQRHLQRQSDRHGGQRRLAIPRFGRVAGGLSLRHAVGFVHGQPLRHVADLHGERGRAACRVELRVQGQQRARHRGGGERQLLWPDGSRDRRQLRLYQGRRHAVFDLGDLRRQALTPRRKTRRAIRKNPPT